MKAKFNLTFFFLFSLITFAQDLVVNGVVKSVDDGLPLPGVNVIVVNSNKGTTTDFDGNYIISASQGDQLEFSSVGFETQIVNVGSQNTININLEIDIEALDEVVVIGYGTAKKRDLTGSIVSVKGDQVADKPGSNPVASLQGKVSGLSIVNSGQVGQEPDIRIRGTSSRYYTKPLYVVDGIFADNIDFVNPNDIESMEILKDPSSLAIFGVRGANGVIIVTTRQAKEGKFSININSSVGIKTITSAPDLADATLFRELYDEGLVNAGSPAFGYYDVFNGNTDWVEEISNESSFIHTTNLSVQNATDRNKISFGLGYRSEDGLIKEEKLERLTFNLNNEFKIAENFKMGLNINGLKDKLPNRGNFGGALNATPIVSPIHYDIRPDYNGVYNQLPVEIGGPQIGNPLLIAEVTKNKAITEKYRFVGNLFAEVDFLKNFTFKATVFGDYDNVRRRSYTPIVGLYVSETDEIANFNGNQITRVNQSTNNVFNFQQEYLLSFKKELGNHDINALAGYTTTQVSSENLSGSVAHDPNSTTGIIPDDPRFWYVNVYPYGDPATRTSSSGQSERATSSFLGRVLYSYGEKYLLNGSYRRDATSQLSPDNRAQDFWSLGAGWVLTDEGFLDNSKTLNFLKLKGSIGELGNQNVPVNYPFYPGVDEGATAVFGGQDSNGDGYPDNDGQAYPGYLERFEENPDLQWESVKSWEVGVESRWLNNKLSFNMNYFNRLTKNLLVFVDTGVKQFFDNFGEIENKGFEFEMSWEDKIGDDFGYSIAGNLTTINNEVLSTREDAAIFSGGSRSRTISGEAIGHFYGYIVDGVYQSNADIAANPTSSLGTYAPGDLKYRDVNGDGEITPEDRTIIGNPTPDFTYGFSTNFTYKSFYLNMDFQGVYGNEIYRDWGNGNSFAPFNYRADRANRWTGPGTSNWEPRLLDTEYNRLPSTYMIEDGSYFRIRNVQLGYAFSSEVLQRINIQQLKVSLSVQNLYTWKETSGFTPEAGGSPIDFGVDTGGYPVPVISTLGVSLTF